MDIGMDFAVPEGDNILSAADTGADDPDCVRIAQAVAQNIESDYFTIGSNLVNTTTLINSLVVEWFINKPDDPIDHATIALCRGLNEVNGLNAMVPEESYLTPESAAYSKKFCIVPLLNELIAAIKKERPDDVATFTMSYLRWGKKGFLLRHQPAGYAALLVKKL